MMMDVFAGLVEGVALNLGQPFDQEFLQNQTLLTPSTLNRPNKEDTLLQSIL